MRQRTGPLAVEKSGDSQSARRFLIRYICSAPRARGRHFRVRLERIVDCPQRAAHRSQRLALRLVAARQFGQHAFGMDPAQGMGQHIEPPGVIAEDRQIGGGAPLGDATEQGAFSHQAKMPRIGNALLRQDRLAGGLIRPAQKA